MTRSDTLFETALSRHQTAPVPARPVAPPLARAGRWMVATVAAVATALGLWTASVVPVRAGNDDLAKALAALAIVGIIAGAANSQPRPPAAHPPIAHPRPPIQRAPKVPASCAIRLSGSQTTATVWSERCIQRSGFGWQLPGWCARPARIWGRDDRIFTEQCLRQAGFRT